MGMIKTVAQAWKVAEIRSKMIFTLLMLVVFRIGSNIPVPNIDRTVLAQMFTGDAGLFDLFDLFSEPFGFSLWRENKTLFILQIFAVILFCSVVFWIGIILVYSCSSQLRMKTRVLGILFAWIPILNIVMLIIIIHTADKEYRFEKKSTISISRAGSKKSARRNIRFFSSTAYSSATLSI